MINSVSQSLLHSKNFFKKNTTKVSEAHLKCHFNAKILKFKKANYLWVFEQTPIYQMHWAVPKPVQVLYAVISK